MKKAKIIFGLILFAVLLLGTVFASMPKNFKDIEVDIDIREVKNGNLEVWWEIENKGNIKAMSHVFYGYSKYDYEKEAWVPILEEEWEEMLEAGVGMGAGGIGLEFEPGYYMFWIKQVNSDKIKENNEDTRFYSVY